MKIKIKIKTNIEIYIVFLELKQLQWKCGEDGSFFFLVLEYFGLFQMSDGSSEGPKIFGLLILLSITLILLYLIKFGIFSRK